MPGAATSYLLVCDRHRTFTGLGRFLPKENRFEGEYSLLHNRHTRDQFFLARFLLAHREHPVRVIGSDGDQYYRVLNTYRRFMEEDIPKYVEERVGEEQAEADRRLAEQQAGQLQLFVVKHWIEREWEDVRRTEAETEKDLYVLLGKDWAFQRSLHAIRRVVGRSGKEG
ncbi:hypothetical protein [Alicyclobacillus sp.]|uniref:hypothetical protein n=1 Tax=Alicyclobacillus sp. TaxID=61169 RepID=UPI0025BA1934|nr:hypothetical protein [Alicyclobacillus sp.]MCL6517254.1 hypothetical protein [Alicyclobacillus sp.]